MVASQAEIAAARQVMAVLGLNGAQIHAAIAHFTRGKNPDFDLEGTLREFAEPARIGGPAAGIPGNPGARLPRGRRHAGPGARHPRVADLLDVSRIELAHMEAVLRIRREQFRANARNGGSAGGRATQGMQLGAYQILEVDPKASDDEVAKAYRRQLQTSSRQAQGQWPAGIDAGTRQAAHAADHRSLRADQVRPAEVDCDTMQTPWIAPSILSADFARLGAEVQSVLDAGADVSTSM